MQSIFGSKDEKGGKQARVVKEHVSDYFESMKLLKSAGMDGMYLKEVLITFYHYRLELATQSPAMGCKSLQPRQL